MKIKYLIEELQKFDPEGEAEARNFRGQESKDVVVRQEGCSVNNPQVVIEAE